MYVFLFQLVILASLPLILILGEIGLGSGLVLAVTLVGLDRRSLRYLGVGITLIIFAGGLLFSASLLELLLAEPRGILVLRFLAVSVLLK